MAAATVERNSLIICGPSGVGKGTVIKSLLSLWGDDRLSLSVSHTTRQPRVGEIDGVHYNFVSKPYMEEALKQPDVFLEYAQVHGNLYGTSRAAVETVHQKGKTCILDVDVDGVRQIKAQHFPGKYVFLTPPSIDVLVERLKGRSTETEAQIALRMQTAEEVITYGTTANNFDLVVVNNDLNETLRILNNHLVDWFPHVFQLQRSPR